MEMNSDDGGGWTVVRFSHGLNHTFRYCHTLILSSGTMCIQMWLKTWTYENEQLLYHHVPDLKRLDKLDPTLVKPGCDWRSDTRWWVEHSRVRETTRMASSRWRQMAASLSPTCCYSLRSVGFSIDPTAVSTHTVTQRLHKVSSAAVLQILMMLLLPKKKDAFLFVFLLCRFLLCV